MQKICDGTGPELCHTVYESSCTSRYLDKTAGKNGTTQFVGDTKCEKFPVKLCGKGCRSEPGPEKCQEREVCIKNQSYNLFEN